MNNPDHLSCFRHLDYIKNVVQWHFDGYISPNMNTGNKTNIQIYF